MKPINRESKYLQWGITAFCVVAAAILFYMALRYIPAIKQWLGKLANIMSPFIWGLVITYLLAPLMKTLQKTVFDPLTGRMKNKARAGKLSRGISILLSEIALIVLLAALIYLIIPQLYSSIETIVVNSNTYVENLTLWVERVLADYPQLESYATNVLGNFNTSIMEWLKNAVLPAAGSLVTNVTTGVYSVVRAIYNLILGMIVSMYLLGNLEGFLAGCRRILYSAFQMKTAEKILHCIRFTDKTFAGFITGKLLDSLIVGIICYVSSAALGIPYALLVSVIVGVTNIIPFFGPFVGAVPCAIIILMVNPMKCLIFIIMVLVLQQIDGNIIGPKILGSSIGIGGIWVMFAIILGAGLFGFFGMLLGVPVFVVIYAGLDTLIREKLEKKGLPLDNMAYRNLDHIDELTLQPVPLETTEPEFPTRNKKTEKKQTEPAEKADSGKAE